MGKQQEGQRTINAGLDEAGRGPLAGPVTAAAVIFRPLPGVPQDLLEAGLSDSKKTSPQLRLFLEGAIRARAWVGYGWASHQEIDRINIHHASLLAMQRAFRGLLRQLAEDPSFETADFTITAFADGKYCPELPAECSALVGGDGIVPEIMAASILAKCARDRFMERYAPLEPLYEFASHKGYPTVRHRRLIGLHGPSAIQRLSYSVTLPPQ